MKKPRKKMKPVKVSNVLDGVPSDPIGAFAWFVGRSAEGVYREMIEGGKTDVQARNTIIHCLLAFAAGEACRIARKEGRDPDAAKWRAATSKAFSAAVKRTSKLTEEV